MRFVCETQVNSKYNSHRLLYFVSQQVSVNGQISFGSEVTDFTDESFPLDDLIIIAPFWADADTSGIGHGDVMYRQITLTDETKEEFGRVNDIFTKTYFDQHPMNATWMFIATWDEVTHTSSDAANFKVSVESNKVLCTL